MSNTMHRYPYLPEGRHIHYVPVTNVYMSHALIAQKTLSSELNHPTGAVVVREGEIIGRAGNQAGIRHNGLQQLHKKGICVRRILGIPSGQKYWLCPGCATYKDHAEARAVRDALSTHLSIEGADLYLYGHWWCCKPCWDAMIRAGIHNVYLVEDADSLFKV